MLSRRGRNAPRSPSLRAQLFGFSPSNVDPAMRLVHHGVLLVKVQHLCEKNLSRVLVAIYLKSRYCGFSSSSCNRKTLKEA